MFSNLSSGVIKSVLGIVGAGGTVGLAYSAPTILWKSGLSCKSLGVDVTGGSSPGQGEWIEWSDGSGYSKLNRGLDGQLIDNAVCYKK